YSSVQSLLEAGLIEEVEPRQQSKNGCEPRNETKHEAKNGDDRRRFYRLTSAGRKLADSETERLADLLRGGRAKKILRGDMSEKFYALLLRLYPAQFREDYGNEAMRLFRDRLEDERGFFPRLRLWFDLVCDLTVSIPREYLRPASPRAVA